MRAFDFVLVVRAPSGARNEDFPDAALDALAHRVTATVPIVEIADDADPARVRSPNGKSGARDPVDATRVGAEDFPKTLMRALGNEIRVDVAEQGPEAVSVFELAHSVAFVDGENVIEGRAPARDAQFEEAVGVDASEFVQLVRVARAHEGALRLRQRCPNDDAAVSAVHAEIGKRIGPETGEQHEPTY